jgi:hypothetical protein
MAYSIKELEALSGIKAHTIRIWEQRYQFLRPSRTQTNIRIYNNDDLKTLLTVALLNKYGYKISRIDDMPPPERDKAVMDLGQPGAHLEGMVNRLIGHMIDLDSVGFERLLNEYMASSGIEKLVDEVVFPFLEKLGILWQTNRIVPVQEHVVSSIIRQKLVSAIDRLPFPEASGPLYLLFLPEDEHHELGLLYIYYLLRKSRQRAIYLGANVPLSDIRYVVNLKKPSRLYIHLTSFPRQHNINRFLKNLELAAGESTVLISGSVTRMAQKPETDKIIFLKSFQEVKSYIPIGD